MNYSTWIIILSVINTLDIFSGLPTGTKKLVIVITTLLLLFIGIVLRAIEQKKKQRMAQKVQSVERDPSIEQVVHAVARDVHVKVEEEIEEITHHELSNHHHYDQENN